MRARKKKCFSIKGQRKVKGWLKKDKLDDLLKPENMTHPGLTRARFATMKAQTRPVDDLPVVLREQRCHHSPWRTG
jgi:hypothetical protein